MADDLPGIVAVDVADPDQQRTPVVPAGPPPSRAEREARGKAARREVPLESHALLAPTELRPDPVELLERQATTRVPSWSPSATGACWCRPSPSTAGRRW